MKRKPPYYDFGRRIARTRKDRKITQRALAACVKLTPIYMCRIERGHAMPSVAVIRRIARALNISVGSILE